MKFIASHVVTGPSSKTKWSRSEPLALLCPALPMPAVMTLVNCHTGIIESLLKFGQNDITVIWIIIMWSSITSHCNSHCNEIFYEEKWAKFMLKRNSGPTIILKRFVLLRPAGCKRRKTRHLKIKRQTNINISTQKNYLIQSLEGIQNENI